MVVEGDGSDRRTVQRVIQWVRDEFAAAAKRHERPGTARLLRFDTEKIPAGQALPSLEEFIAAEGWEDFGEAEQSEAYAEKYGLGKPRKNGRARLIAKQTAALGWLESVVVQDPAAGDQVEAWLSPALASKLRAAGVPTLFALAERINGLGEGWHRNIPGIGAGKAGRILTWLKDTQASTQLQLGAHAGVARKKLEPAILAAVVPASTALRPFEKFIVPAELDGSAGRYRAPPERSQLEASNDYQAVHAWLKSKRAGEGGQLSPTQRAYRKEAERLLLWSVLQQGKALSSLTVEDASAYLAFLGDPPAAWCGPRHHQRWSPMWRPLEGALDASACAQAITILRSLFTWLNAQGYLYGNPFAAITRPLAVVRPIGSGRTLTRDQIESMLDELRRLPDSSANRRLQLALPWLYFTGLRQAEMVAARCSHLTRFEPAKGGAGSWLQDVIGKGGRHRQVPLPAGLVNLLADALERMGKPRDPRAAENKDVPILAIVEGGVMRAMSASALYQALKRFFRELADKVETSDPGSANRLRLASAHWMRHSHSSHSVNGGPGRDPVPVHIARENLGHASLDTTTGYITTELDDRVTAMQGFFHTA